MKITMGPGVQITLAELQESLLFQDWARREVESVQEVVVTSADTWGGELRMVQMRATALRHPWPHTVTLRSETVDVLTEITDGTRRWVVFVNQERIAAGCRVTSSPAGGREWHEDPVEAAIREVREELGLADDVMIKVERLLPHPVLASPGAINERVYMMRATITVAPDKTDAFVASLHGRNTGVEAEGEEIVLAVVTSDIAWQVASEGRDSDAKTLFSLSLAGLRQ